MKKMAWNRAILIALAVAAASCAEQRPPVDRVQPYALDKEFFLGEDFADPADDPEFWTQATLVDVGYGAAQSGLFTSTWTQSMSRLRWQVTEDLLLGRLAYERIDNSDGKGVGGATEDGVVVVAFAIESHFDIVHAYNPTTGEKLNVLEENSSDRPWYERRYMRVDFSRNLNVDAYDFDTLSLLGILGGYDYEPLGFYVDDPTAKDAPHFDLEHGYFDVTVKAFAEPAMVDLSHLGWGLDALPACWLDNDFMQGTSPAGSCDPVELTVRHSFRRVEDHDYEPVDWDGYRFQAYGGFFEERYGYARNYGMSDEMWHRFLTRYQIWQHSHYYADPIFKRGPVECFTPETTPYGADPHRDEDMNGTEDECEVVGGGSRCDEFAQRCTLPFRARVPVTVPWYFTSGSNQEYFEATELAAHEWDVALRTAVRAAQYAECERIGGDDCAAEYPIYFGQQDDNSDAVALALEVDDCRRGRTHPELDGDADACAALADDVGAARGYSPGVISIAKMDEVITLCHSPVEAGDHPACGYPRLPSQVTAADCAAASEAGDPLLTPICRSALNVRRGDLRYHLVNVIEEPQTPSPWGIYTDAEDPLTGETISAAINVWSHVTDLFSQKVIDQARFAAGELTEDDITGAEYVRDWAAAAEAAARGGAFTGLTRAELDSRVAAFTGSENVVDAQAIENFKSQHPGLYDQALTLRRELEGVAAAVDAPATTTAMYAARREAAAGSEVEAALMTPMVQELAGVDGMPLDEGLMALASPLRGGNPGVQRDLARLEQNAVAERGGCILHEAQAPLAIAGLSDVLQEKFGAFDPNDDAATQHERAERMRRYVARRAHYSVIAHEMGHSIGARHNFVSSSDAWGYRPQYWQLRTKDGVVAAPCADYHADGNYCVGPRYFDPVSDEERDNLIWMFMQSSIMDYAGEYTQDFIGIGAWDFAAARMFYGDVAAVHADSTYQVGGARANGMLAKMDNFGGILGIQPRFASQDIHYSQYQQYYQLIDPASCQVVDAERFRPARYDEQRDGAWSPLLDGMIVDVGGEPTRCRQQPVDYVDWSELRFPTTAEFSDYYRGGPSIDGRGRVRMPYGFATDRWADLGNASVYRHDNGADVYEIFNFLATQQELHHLWDTYRRDQQDFSVRKAANRRLSRYNEKIRDGAKGLTLIRNIYKDFALEVGYNFDDFWPVIAPEFFPQNIVASGMVFDHFARNEARPEIGPHYIPTHRVGDPQAVLEASADTLSTSPGEEVVTIYNGATGYFGDMSPGGALVENQLSEDHGDYDSEYTMNAGSYYDKMYTAMLMTESVDNFISDSLSDFVDKRYRAVSLADLFPDGYRRWLGNNLTGDDFLKGPRIAADEDGVPLTDTDGFPAQGIGWTSWWTESPQACFPADGTNVCAGYGTEPDTFAADAPEHVAVIDPQVGWEQQKFLIAWTLLYLPENQQQEWIDLLRVWELGVDADPSFDNRIELHYPGGKSYVARRFGREEVFGKTVEKGIAARVLEYANELLHQAYETVDGPDLDEDSVPDWYEVVWNEETGEPIVRWDPTVSAIDGEGYVSPDGVPGCNEEDNSECTCAANRACVALARYVEVPFFLRQTLDAYKLVDPEAIGIWD